MASTSRLARANFTRCSAPTAPARRRRCAWSPGCCRPTAGEIRIFGVDARRDPVAAKRIVAWLPDEPMLYDKLDPLEYLEFVAGLWGVEPRRARERAKSCSRRSASGRTGASAARAFRAA